MSRKTLMAVIAIIGVILTFFKDQFGLNIDVTSILAGISAILLYILWEAKNDLKKLATQPKKWKDLKFWITFISVVLAAINQNFGTGIPVELIISGLTVIVGFLFKVNIKKPEY